MRVVRSEVRRGVSAHRVAAANFTRRRRRRRRWPGDVEQHDIGAVSVAGRTARQRAPHHIARHTAVSGCRLHLRDNGMTSLLYRETYLFTVKR